MTVLIFVPDMRECILQQITLEYEVFLLDGHILITRLLLAPRSQHLLAVMIVYLWRLSVIPLDLNTRIIKYTTHYVLYYITLILAARD